MKVYVVIAWYNYCPSPNNIQGIFVDNNKAKTLYKTLIKSGDYDCVDIEEEWVQT